MYWCLEAGEKLHVPNVEPQSWQRMVTAAPRTPDLSEKASDYDGGRKVFD